MNCTTVESNIYTYITCKRSKMKQKYNRKVLFRSVPFTQMFAICLLKYFFLDFFLDFCLILLCILNIVHIVDSVRVSSVFCWIESIASTWWWTHRSVTIITYLLFIVTNHKRITILRFVRFVLMFMKYLKRLYEIIVELLLKINLIDAEKRKIRKNTGNCFEIIFSR